MTNNDTPQPDPIPVDESQNTTNTTIVAEQKDSVDNLESPDTATPIETPPESSQTLSPENASPENYIQNQPTITASPQPSTPPEPAVKPEPLTTTPHASIQKPEAPTTVPQPQPFDISSLSDADLKAAATLYTKRNQAEISRKGVAKRQQTMELNLREIADFLSLNNGSPLPRIAKRTNITPGTTSKYLRQLIASGKVRATGWGKTRRYYLK